MNLLKLMHKTGVDRMQVSLINGEPHPALIALADELELHWKKTVTERDEYAEELRAEVEKLTKERDEYRLKYQLKADRAHECCKRESELEEQLAALAEQNEKMKEALLFVMGVTCLAADENPESPIFRVYKVSSDAYELPNLTTPVLNKYRAEGMRVAAEIAEAWQTDDTCEVYQCSCSEAIRARADELEKINAAPFA